MKRKGLFFIAMVLSIAGVFFIRDTWGMPSMSEGGISSAKKAEVLSKMNVLHIPFIANTGQVDKEVAFYAKTFGGTVFITDKGEIVYSLPEGLQNHPSPQSSPLRGEEGLTDIPSPLKGEGEGARAIALKESLVDAEIKGIEGRGEAITKVSYFTGKDPKKWKGNIPTYDMVSLGEVYKGIELRLKAYGNNVEKLFYVRPDASLDDIKLTLKGAKGIRVNKEGELEVDTELGAVRFTKPVAYQEIEGKRVEVEVEYVIARSEIPRLSLRGASASKQSQDGLVTGSAIPEDKIATHLSGARNGITTNPSQIYAFKVGKYDRTKELIIDPLLSSTFIGGSSYGYDYAYALAIDSSGNVLVAGYTGSSDYPTTAGAYDRIYNGSIDAFVSKLNISLTSLLSSTFIGGSDVDEAYALAIDSSGNVLVAGYTGSSDYPTTAGAYDTTHNGYWDVYVSKLNSNLTSLLSSTFIGGSDVDVASALGIDSSGNVLVAGWTRSSGYPTTLGAYDATSNGGYDAFVSKLNSSLATLSASTFIGGSDGDYAYALAIDSSGNVLVAGYTWSSSYPATAGAYDTTYNGVYDVFVSKLNSTLTTLSASTFIGGSNSDWAHALGIDSSGNVLVAGETSSSDYPTTAGAYDTTYNGGYDAFASMLNNTLTTLSASTFMGGSDHDYAYAFGIDSSGNVLVAGTTTSSDYPATAGAYDTIHNGYYDVFVSKLNSTLTTLSASTFIGGSSVDQAYAFTIDSSGNVLVAGGTYSSDYPTTAGAYDTTFNGGNTDVFVSKLDSNLSAAAPDLIVQSIATSPTTPTAGQSVDVTVTVKNQSGADAGAFDVDFYKDRASAPGPYQVGDFSCSKTSLATGVTDTCTGTVSYSATGTYSMWAQVDTNQMVTESDEGNNVFGPQTITVLPTVTLVPDSTSIPRGGTLGYNVTVTNNTSTIQTFQYWTYVTLPNGSRYPATGELFGPVNVSLNPGQTGSAHLTHGIPAIAPLGTYIYYGNVGTYPTVWDSDSFNFTVTSTASPGTRQNWELLEDNLTK